MSSEGRFVVGIDLGTTNSVVAFCDVSGVEPGPIELLALPQLSSPGNVEERPSLPSFLYLPTADEVSAGATSLPWGESADWVAGFYAQKRGAQVPTRVIHSAKSWLCHPTVDRTAPILPWDSPDDVARLSPVEVTRRYLQHIHHAWDHHFPQAPLAAQQVFLTAPASFDAAARQLTADAAAQAGLANLTILEEPQAAFYAWIDAHGDAWREKVQVGDIALIVDIGGGTTDFSLIAVADDDGALGLERIAVGHHLLLGGDNMDLTLAHAVRGALTESGKKIDAWQFRGLVQACREAKESLLADATKTKAPIAILGRGSKLIGGTLRTEIQRDEIEKVVVDGFFPSCTLDEPLAAEASTSLQELSLPYAADPAITRHLAAFLRRHGMEDRPPTAILFNGGVTKAPGLRERVLHAVGSWFPDAASPLRELPGADAELAVARGAAYYGLAKQGRGVRIRGGTARSYYIGIETAMPSVPGMQPPIKALCVAPRGIEEGTDVDLPERSFGLVVGKRSRFRFLSSEVRADDAPGTLIEDWEEEIDELESLETALEREGEEGDVVPVKIQARVNEMGVLEVWCLARDSDERWKLELDVRGTSGKDDGP